MEMYGPFLEEWKYVHGYGVLYSISNYGRVRSKNKKDFKSLRIGSHGYLITDLYLLNKQTTFLIHRLVADHFCKKENNFNVVNHIDFNKHNNVFYNLEWTDTIGNITHSINRINENRFSKSVIKIDKISGEKLEYYNSISEAAKSQKTCVSSISNAIKGLSKTSGGYVWKYG